MFSSSNLVIGLDEKDDGKDEKNGQCDAGNPKTAVVTETVFSPHCCPHVHIGRLIVNTLQHPVSDGIGKADFFSDQPGRYKHKYGVVCPNRKVGNAVDAKR